MALLRRILRGKSSGTAKKIDLSEENWQIRTTSAPKWYSSGTAIWTGVVEGRPPDLDDLYHYMRFKIFFHFFFPDKNNQWYGGTVVQNRVNAYIEAI